MYSFKTKSENSGAATREWSSSEKKAYPSAFGNRSGGETKNYSYGKDKQQAGWKSKPEVVAPKIDSMADFPSLQGATKKSSQAIPEGISLADKLRVQIAAEEEASARRNYREKQMKEEENTEVLVLHSFARKKYLEKKRQEELQRAEEEEEEKNYAWQIDREGYGEVNDDEEEVPYDDENAEPPVSQEENSETMR